MIIRRLLPVVLKSTQVPRTSTCQDQDSPVTLSAGASASHLLRQLDCNEITRIEVIDAAAVCCSRGVFPQDIKMPNLLINTETLEVKSFDFGCGDLLKSSSYNTYSGTAMYFEKGEYHGKEATVWSLGVLLFAMITSLFPDSSDIGLMDIDVWFQPGFSDGVKFITAKKDN